jgi:hypothetical protein
MASDTFPCQNTCEHDITGEFIESETWQVSSTEECNRLSQQHTARHCTAYAEDYSGKGENIKMKKASGDWGGISFQCAETPFTSVTGNEETLLGGGEDRAEGGKKNYTCKCIQASEGGEASFTEYTISAWSSLAAGRRCKRMGRSCYLVSAYGT